MISIQEALDKVNNAIDGMAYENKPSELYNPVRYILSLGGKRIRPILVLLGYNIYKEDVDVVIPPALGWEIFHNYTLLHDDLMDRADMRRGKLTVHKKWNDNAAILSGDLMQTIAYQYITKIPDLYLRKVLDLFSITASEIFAGQQYDMNFESRMDVKEEEYLEMIRLKTAVMPAACLKTGAIIAGADPKDADKLYNFGINLGLAFQLKDDLLDVFGDAEVFGKKIGGDILCNKKTFLLIHALNKSSGKEKENLLQWLSNSDTSRSEDKIKAVTEIYQSLGVKEFSEQKIQYYHQQSVTILQDLNKSSKNIEVLFTLTEQLMNRNI